MKQAASQPGSEVMYVQPVGIQQGCQRLSSAQKRTGQTELRQSTGPEADNDSDTQEGLLSNDPHGLVHR